MRRGKPKVALAWCSSCGGCDEVVLDLGPDLLDILEGVEIVYWPFALDLKRHDLERLDEQEIAISLINGSIRTEEHRELVELLRTKSKIVIALGACAIDGGVHALANLLSHRELLGASFVDSATVENPEARLPRRGPVFGDLEDGLPELSAQVAPLDEAIDVDFAIPGCPPSPEVLARALDVLLAPGLPPARGTRLAPTRALCDTCPRRESRRGEAELHEVFMPHQVQPDPERCLLEQGLLCCGPATRSGCGELCIQANMPCTGCFGPPLGVADQGAKMLTAIASLFSGRTKRRAEELTKQVLDPAGTFYRYGLPRMTLKLKGR